jgi:hypothetical protein
MKDLGIARPFPFYVGHSAVMEIYKAWFYVGIPVVIRYIRCKYNNFFADSSP